jgi:hypothetical protein
LTTDIHDIKIGRGIIGLVCGFEVQDRQNWPDFVNTAINILSQGNVESTGILTSCKTNSFSTGLFCMLSGSKRNTVRKFFYTSV